MKIMMKKIVIVMLITEKVMMTIMMLIMIIIMIIVRLTINSNIITYLVVSVDALPIIFHPLSLQILIFDRLY